MATWIAHFRFGMSELATRSPAKPVSLTTGGSSTVPTAPRTFKRSVSSSPSHFTSLLQSLLSRSPFLFSLFSFLPYSLFLSLSSIFLSSLPLPLLSPSFPPIFLCIQCISSFSSLQYCLLPYIHVHVHVPPFCCPNPLPPLLYSGHFLLCSLLSGPSGILVSGLRAGLRTLWQRYSEN